MPCTAYQWGAQGVAGKLRSWHQLGGALKDAGLVTSSPSLHGACRHPFAAEVCWRVGKHGDHVQRQPSRLSSPVGFCVCAIPWPTPEVQCPGHKCICSKRD